jgi:hypothetical protein
MKQRVKLLVRPTVKGKRHWIEVSPKKQYEPGTSLPYAGCRREPRIIAMNPVEPWGWIQPYASA